MRLPDVDTISTIALVIFAAGLAFGTGSTVFRMVALRRRRMHQPRLIWRDVAVFGLLSVDFLLIALHRALGWEFAGQVWWALLTSGIAVAAVGVYAYYELRVIGHVREHAEPDETPIQAEDRAVGDERRRLQALAEEDEVAS
jgi:hypothetical protein